METETVKPCKCGNSELVVGGFVDQFNPHLETAYVGCVKCGEKVAVTGDIYNQRRVAIKLWNYHIEN